MAPFSITPDFKSTACEGVPPRVGSALSWPERRDADIVEALHLLHFTANDEIYADVSNKDAIFKSFSGVVRTCNFRNSGRWRMKLELLASLMIGTSSVAVASSPAPTLVQFNTSGILVFASSAGDTSLAFTKLTKAGDAIWVAVTVPYDPAKSPHTISISDSQGNTFKKLNQVNDGYPGIQSVAHFVATNIRGDVTKPDTITVHWTPDNYKGILVAEVRGASGAAVLEGNNARVMDGVVGPGSGDVRSYSWIGKPNTLILAISMNTDGGCSDTGGTGQPGPGVGTGFTKQLKTWASSDCPSIPLATFETMLSNSTGNINGAFDSSSGTNYYASVAAGFN